MATAKQKQIAKTNRDNAVKAMKKAKTPAAKAKQKAKVAALSKIMKSKTTSEETTAGSTKHALAKIARDQAKTTRSAAVKKMQDLKPKSKAWQKARRNVVTASSNVRKQGNVMRDVSGREMGQYTSYTGPRDAMRKYIQDVEASKGGKALTKLGDKTEFTQINQIMLSEMPGKTYADKRKAWDEKWGQPGSKSYKDMQDEQAERHSEMINDPDYDPDFVPKIFDNLPDTTVTQPTVGPGTFTADIPGSQVYGDGIFGPPNPTVPSFGYPAYQDWTRFMPTNFQLAEGGGMHYQPWASGLPVGGGGGPILPPPGGGGGGGGTTTGPGVINPNIWNTSTTTTTPTTGVIPGSDKANDLAAGRTHHPEMYDANDMWVGAEGAEVGGRGLLGATQDIGGQITGNAPNVSVGYPNRSRSPLGPTVGVTDPGNLAHTDPRFKGQTFWDDPRYTGPLTTVPTVSPSIPTVAPVTVPSTSYDGIAAAQQRYLASLDDESARRMMNMSAAQQEREAADIEAAAMSRVSGASAAQSARMAAARSRAASSGGNGGGGRGGGGGGGGGGREGGREN